MRKHTQKFSAALLAMMLVVSLIAPQVGFAATSSWPSFRGNPSNMAIVDAATPATKNDATLFWTSKLKEVSDWDIAVGDPLIINGDIYIPVGNTLRVIDSESGKEKTRATLDGTINFTCRPVFTNDMVIVPLAGGSVQAFDADTLTSLWTSDALDNDPTYGAHQNMTTLFASGNYVYFGTACADWTTSYKGSYLCIDTRDGSKVWTYENDSAGYYWSGGVLVGDAFVFAGDDGKLVSVNAADGTQLASLDLGAPVRSTIASSEGSVYVVTQNGTLHVVPVKSDGTFGTRRQVSFGASSTASPVVVAGKIFVGGADASYTGVLAVIDASTLAVEKTFTTPALVQSSALVSTGTKSGTAVYFTSNTEPGGIYVVTLADMAGAAPELYIPTGDFANYCMASVIAGEDGTLYYTNDSGYLFAIQQKEDTKDPDDGEKDPSDETTVVPTPISTPDDSTASTPTVATAASANPKTSDSVPNIFAALLALSLGVLAIGYSTKGLRREDGLHDRG